MKLRREVLLPRNIPDQGWWLYVFVVWFVCMLSLDVAQAVVDRPARVVDEVRAALDRMERNIEFRMAIEDSPVTDGKFSVFICGRGQTEVKPTCEVCRVHPQARACAYPLRGERAGQTCGRKLCKSCQVDGLCPAHARLSVGKATR